MEREPLLETGPLLPETADYDTLRCRERMDATHHAPSPNKWTFMRCGGMFLVAIIVAGICLAVFLPGPLAQLENPSIFGGMFSISDDERYNVNNHFTQDVSCPDGYSEHAVARFLACYQCDEVELYLCLHDEVHKDPKGFFGGMYNTNECGATQYVNPLTNSYGCDGKEGYLPYLAIASQTQHFCDTNVYVCLKGELQDDVLLGGFYTEFVTSNGCGTCSDGNVNNAMIDSLECPDNYLRRMIAYTYSPGAVAECPGCNGRAYACLMRLQNQEEGEAETEQQSDAQ
mmetsp:Transcript_46322/g.74279  ORF Transcript_46322/g.74279 Transcript_46322/m.74279 type:complete len:286 (+) Transcript_46322:19-876(+)|eukprot:CAMPEP_0197050538 /NCGR_PEP_ID=MMETSP1384-20130603/25406_1 /TAXON_ID=29189 /ORGANISM="Ammonia sp." /LENGTH=285 /DNA_ID=CAMNT_0042482957 /DNA_START=14 /DNA_END=871 /DNA_ORIENTATION=-